MERLILHIGTMKTATTALQHFFAINREKLSAGGVDFPPFGRNSDVNGLFLSKHGQFLSTGEIPDKVREYTRSLAEVFPAYVAEHSVALLTDERLFREGTIYEGFWPALRDYLSQCGVKRVEIVVYLRRQDLFVASYWKQSVKEVLKETRSFEEFRRDVTVCAHMDYDTALARIEECFGRDAVNVRRYDRAAFAGGDIFHDFCAAIGLPWDDAFILPERRENPSLTCTVAEVKRLANMSNGYRTLPNNFFMEPTLAVSRIYPEPTGATPLAPEDAKALLAEYAEGNRRVAERYLGGEPLFPEPYEFGPKWEREDAAVLNAAITMFAEALAAQQQKIDRLERLLRVPFLGKVKRRLSQLWEGRN